MGDTKTEKAIVEVSAKDVQESNHILRKLYEEMRRIKPINWQFSTYRKENNIFLGYTNLGDLWIHYKTKGIIDKIGFLRCNKEDQGLIEAAIKEADSNHEKMLCYSVRAEFFITTAVLSEMAKDQIHIVGEKVDDFNSKIIVTFNVNAYGDYDVNYVVKQKVNYLRLLLSIYTNMAFDYPRIWISNGEQDIPDIFWSGYDEEWIDFFYDSTGKENAVLLPDFFTLFRYVLNHDCYSKNMRLVLNAAQDFFCAVLMKKRLIEDGDDILPGIVDTINTMLISALEPLSCIGKEKPQICPACGNTIYKISSHIRELCKEYLGEFLAKEIVNRGYKNRSIFLHEGNARTNEFRCGNCYPQLDPISKNEIMWVTPLLENNFFDYVSYIIRKKIHDLLLTPGSLDE